MVHRRYRVSERVIESSVYSEVDQPAYIRTPKNYASEMSNGSTVLTEEQQSLVNKGKQKFRDEVSKRMGDLLLRGNTMLDAYCQVCNGILMEDRQKVRCCIQCDLYKEMSLEKVPSVIAEIPLDHDADGFVPGNSHLAVRSTVNMKNVDQDSRMSVYETGIVTTYDDTLRRGVSNSPVVESKRDINRSLRTSSHESRHQVLKTAPISRSVIKNTKMENSEEAPKLNGLHKVISAVDAKMDWCAGKLNETEDLEHMSRLLDVVASGIRVLNDFKLSGL